VEVTINRGDCLSYIGIARELSAVTGRPLKMPEVELKESEKNVTDLASVEIIEPDLCGRYTARIIEGLKVGPSPQWLVQRLEKSGLRTVNNVVDATNYAMLETGQPPHAFDYAKITGGKIIVRRAIAGERLVSIDGTVCDLSPDMLIIADSKRPVAVAGVMGGLETEVTDETTTVLLEDAYFDPVSVRTTSRRLSLPSEAAFRFERIVDIQNIDWASKRTAQLITELAGGSVARGVVDIFPAKVERKQVKLRLSRLNKLLGIEVPRRRVIEILSALSFEPREDGDSIVCAVPSWRNDVYREVDLIEEVARLHGYDKVPTRQKIEISVKPVNPRQKFANSIGTFLSGCGFFEAITVSFVDKRVAGFFAETEQPLAVQHCSRRSENILRQSLIGSLLAVLKTNINAKNRPCRLYELADVFIPNQKDISDMHVEKTKLALVCDGDLRDIRGVVEAMIREINREADIVFKPAELRWAQAGARIIVNDRLVGTEGIISDRLKKHFDFKDLCPVAAELDFETLLSLRTGPVKARPIPRFPAIERDLSVIVDESVCWSELVDAVNRKAPAELEGIEFVDIYRGKGIPPGKKSITFSLRFRDQDGTLTHQVVDGFQAAIVQSLAEAVQAQLRTA